LQATEHSIVGGRQAPPRAYPWMMTLFELYKANQYFDCGGTLIDPTHVLTAAHCSLSTTLDNEQHVLLTGPTDPEQVVVARRPASLAALNDDDFIAVRSIAVHPRFGRSSADYDLAVWELATPVHLAEYPRLMTSPAVLDWLSALHISARVIGYGARSQEDEEGSDKLLQVDVPLVSREQCRDDYSEGGPDIPPEEIISDRMICAGVGGKDACYGDSGGPLFLPVPGKAPLLAGVVSWSAACADPNYPGVYTNVTALTDYIRACQAGECETLQPERDCDLGYLDCDGDMASNGCETLPASPATCGAGCGAPACAEGEACLIGEGFRCAPAKPVIPSARCVSKEPDEFGEYWAWFSMLNENEGNVLLPFSDQRFSDGAEPFVSIEVMPPTLIEYATLVILERPDAGSYSVRGPDGQERTASITAETPACETESGEAPEQLASPAASNARRVHDSARVRRRRMH
jgi:trypsin